MKRCTICNDLVTEGGDFHGECAMKDRRLLHDKLDRVEQERDKLKAEVERLKDDKDLVTGQLQQSRKHVSAADLQLSEARKALYDEVKGVTCGPDCAFGGYRHCTGCDTKVKTALGLKAGQSIYDFEKDTKPCVNEIHKEMACMGCGAVHDPKVSCRG